MVCMHVDCYSATLRWDRSIRSEVEPPTPVYNPQYTPPQFVLRLLRTLAKYLWVRPSSFHPCPLASPWSCSLSDCLPFSSLHPLIPSSVKIHFFKRCRQATNAYRGRRLLETTRSRGLLGSRVRSAFEAVSAGSGWTLKG